MNFEYRWYLLFTCNNSTFSSPVFELLGIGDTFMYSEIKEEKNKPIELYTFFVVDLNSLKFNPNYGNNKCVSVIVCLSNIIIYQTQSPQF